MEEPNPITVTVNTDQTMLAAELLKTQSYIRALSKTLFNEEQQEAFDKHYVLELERLSQEFLETYKDLLKK